MTWYDQRKCEQFLRDPKTHFKNTKIINFDINRKKAAGEKILDEAFKKYQTVTEGRTSKWPKKDQKKFLSHAL